MLNVGFGAVKQRPVALIGGFFLVLLLSLLPEMLPPVLTLSGVIKEGSGLYFGLQGIVMLVALVLGSFLWVGQIRVGLAAARQLPFDINLFFSGADRLVPMMVMSVLVYVGVTLGMVLLIVPGVVLALGWALAGPLVVDAGYAPMEALRESWEAMKGHKLQMFLFGIVSVLILSAGFCACCVAFLIVLPAVMIAYMEAFRRITGRMNGAAATPVQGPPPGGAGAVGGWMAPPRVP